MPEINMYCDESNHLERDGISAMVLGTVYVPKERVRAANVRIREIKSKHSIGPNTEIKWTKVSKNKLSFYLDLIDYFFDTDYLHFRAIVVDKTKLEHDVFGQTHDEFYYKMYFELLSKVLDPQNAYNIYPDIKDTRGARKIKKLKEVLCNSVYDFDGAIIKRIQLVRSDELEVLQLADVLIGAIQYLNRCELKSFSKLQLIERMKQRSGYDLSKSTLVREPKTNIFYWRGGGRGNAGSA